jgi:hypothetical protein
MAISHKGVSAFYFAAQYSSLSSHLGLVGRHLTLTGPTGAEQYGQNGGPSTLTKSSMPGE